MTDEPTRRSGWRIALGVIGAIVVIAGVAVAGVLYGRSSAPGPDIVVQPEPVTEASPVAPVMPVASLPGLPTTPPVLPPTSLPPAASGAPSPSPSASPSATSSTTLTVGATITPARWPVVLTPGTGLPDTPTTASGYRLTRAGISVPQVAAVLASTFGLTGAPVQGDDGWTVGTTGGPTLTVRDDPLVSWTYTDAAVAASPAVGEQLEPARAIELTSAVLQSIGVDTTAVDWQVDRYSGRTAATAWQLVAGERTQLSWQLAFDASGAVVQASGFSAGIEEVPGYPVVGAVTAVTRSATSPWSAVGPTPVSGPTATDASASPSPSPSADKPGVAVPVTEAVVTEATLGLAQFRQPDGGVLMLPAYLLTAEDGSRWSMLAVDEPYVDFVDLPYPTRAR